MPRIRTFYQNDVLYVGPSPATGKHFSLADTDTYASRPESRESGTNQVFQLHRIQSISYDFGVERTPIFQFGGIAAKDRAILAPPRVSLGFTYLLANLWNESGMGFLTKPYASCISGILNKTSDDKNYFIKTVKEGEDAQKNTVSNSDVIVFGIGNGFITNYSFEAAVGDLPRVTVAIEGLNARVEQTVSGRIPAINPDDGTEVQRWFYRVPTASGDAGTGNLEVSVLRPGDIFFTIKKRDAEEEGSAGPAEGDYDTVGPDLDTVPIQRVALGFSLARDVIGKLGSRYGVSREIRFPVPVTVSVDALVGDILSGSLTSIVNCDDSYDITLDCFRPSGCINAARYIMAKYIVKNAKLNSQSYRMDIGSNKMATFEFESSIGGPGQTGIGLFMSGISAPAGSVP